MNSEHGHTAVTGAGQQRCEPESNYSSEHGP